MSRSNVSLTNLLQIRCTIFPTPSLCQIVSTATRCSATERHQIVYSARIQSIVVRSSRWPRLGQLAKLIIQIRIQSRWPTASRSERTQTLLMLLLVPLLVMPQPGAKDTNTQWPKRDSPQRHRGAEARVIHSSFLHQDIIRYGTIRGATLVSLLIPPPRRYLTCLLKTFTTLSLCTIRYVTRQRRCISNITRIGSNRCKSFLSFLSFLSNSKQTHKSCPHMKSILWEFFLILILV